MSINKPSSEEEEYFKREEAERLHALAKEKARAIEEAERERLKQLHHMRCPKCGMELHTVQFKGFAVDKCFHCNGTWLDAGELEALAGKETHVWQALVSMFKGK
jgi:hypothetical protein